MKADWDEVWRHFNGPESDRSEFVVCMVNAENILEISQEHGVSSYPSILHYPPGSKLPSQGSNKPTPHIVTDWLLMLSS
jgi:hypothetical protein